MENDRNILWRGIRALILILLGLYLLFVAVGFIIYAFIKPDVSAIELLKTIFEFSLWASVPVLLIALLLRAWRVSAVALAAVILFAVVFIPKLTPRNPDFDSSAPQLTVMTFNLKTTDDGLEQIIRDAAPDIVALQELSAASADIMRALEDVYPHQALHPQADPNEGQGIISRYPIIADEYWEYPEVPHTLGHQRVEIDFDGTTLVMYNVHPWPPLAWEAGYNDDSHRLVLQDITERTFAETLPLILVGDFNMTDKFEEHARLEERFTDSYLAAGDGVGYTFPNFKFRPLPAVLRLDYVWHSDHFQSVESQVWPESGGSDHAPVVSTLAFVGAGGGSRE